MARRIAGYSGFLLVVVVAGRDVTAERFIWNRERRVAVWCGVVWCGYIVNLSAAALGGPRKCAFKFLEQMFIVFVLVPAVADWCQTLVKPDE